MWRNAIDRLLKRPVVILTPGEPVTDEYGVEHPGAWTGTEALAWLEQTITTEVVVGAEVYQADWLLLLGPGVALLPWDRVEVPDIPATFEVIGIPARERRAPTDEEHHVEARLRFVNTGPAPAHQATGPEARRSDLSRQSGEV